MHETDAYCATLSLGLMKKLQYNKLEHEHVGSQRAPKRKDETVLVGAFSVEGIGLFMQRQVCPKSTSR